MMQEAYGERETARQDLHWICPHAQQLQRAPAPCTLEALSYVGV